jgi:Uri superfamily endonuclease
MKGIYVLVIRLRDQASVSIGALGEITFEKGLYLYVGSAQTNLEQRVKRHLRKEKRKFWHIDYLLDSGAAEIEKVLCKEGSKVEECRLAIEIAKRGQAVQGFGCSDCRCRSHLFHVGNYSFLQGGTCILETGQ